MRLRLLSAAILTAVPWSSADKCGTDGCAEFPVFWWVWGANQTNLTAPFGMQPLARTQLGGHCSALTPIPKRIQRRTNTTSEWSQGAWPRSLPQNDTAAKLAAHIAALEAQLPHCIPDPEFDGNAIFDLEMWDPVWEMNNCTYLGNAIYPGAFDAGGVCMAPPSGVPGSGWRGQHQIDSIARVRSKHPDWPHAKLVAQAKHDFQAAAALFMIKTMETVKRIRPKAQWGYYMFPYKLHGPCHRKSGSTVCGSDDGDSWGRQVSALYTADWLLPAWRAVDAIFPSIYLSKGVSKDLQRAYIRENVHLSHKIANATQRGSPSHRKPKILPFGTLYYHGEFGPTAAAATDSKEMSRDWGATPRRKACLASLKALNETARLETLWLMQEQAGLMDAFDVSVQFEASLEAKADGLILWVRLTQLLSLRIIRM